MLSGELGSPLVDMDETLFRAINGLAGRSGLVDQIMLELGHGRNFLIPGLLVFAYWFWRRRREALVGVSTLTGVIIIGDFIGAQLKHLAARPRPCQVLQQVHEIVTCGGTFSFPSNHALNTATAAAFFQTLYPMTGWVSWPLVAVIGFSRVYLGGHYVSDVLGGWTIGGGIGVAAALLLSRWAIFRPAQAAHASSVSTAERESSPH